MSVSHRLALLAGALALPLAAPVHATAQTVAQSAAPAETTRRPVPTADAPAPAPKPAAKPAADAKKRKAIFESADGNFKMDVFARLQLLYQFGDPDALTNQVAYGSSFANKAPVDQSSGFRMRRGRLGVEGFAYNPRFEYQVQLELAGATTTLKRGYFNWRARDAAQVRVGKFKVPFGRQQLTSFYLQQAVDRSLVSDEFAKGDDDGVMVWGTPRAGTLEYYAGVFNGEGNNKNSANRTDNQFAVRGVWSPLGKVAYTAPSFGSTSKFLVSLGAAANWNGGAFFDVNGTTGLQNPLESCAAGVCTLNSGDDSRIRHVGADLALKYRGFSATSEVFGRRLDPRQAGLRSIDARGWYAQAGYFLRPDRLEAGVRYGQLDPNTAAEGDRVGELTPFVNVYLSGNDVKVQADFTRIDTQTTDRRATAAPRTARLDDSRLRVAFVVQY